MSPKSRSRKPSPASRVLRHRPGAVPTSGEEHAATPTVGEPVPGEPALGEPTFGEPDFGEPGPARGRWLALPALEPVYATFLRGAAELAGLPGPLQAELWTSQQLGVLESAAPHAAGLRSAMIDLVGYLRDAGTPGAVLFLRAFAAIGPAELAAPAAKVAAGLPDDGLPAWAAALGTATPGETFVLQDGGLDGDRLGCEFRYPGPDGGQHALLVRLTHEVPAEALVIGDVPGMRAQIGKAIEAEECVLLRTTPTAAGARLRAAYADSAKLPRDLIPTAALIRHRAGLLV